jgi:streptogramin lyase
MRTISTSWAAATMSLLLAACGGGSGGGGGPAAVVEPPPAVAPPSPVVTPPPQPGISLFAGSLSREGSTDGPAAEAQFRSPRDVAQAPDGSVYIADSGNAVIRRLSPQGAVTTVAGSAGVTGYADGVGAAVRFASVDGLTVDGAGNVYIADAGNHVVRRLAPDGQVTTVAGKVGQRGLVDGSPDTGRLDSPTRVRLDRQGRLMVLDAGNRAIRRLAPDGTLGTFWRGAEARMPDSLSGLCADAAGNWYVSFISVGSHVDGSIVKIDAAGQQVAWGGPGGTLSLRDPMDVAVDAGDNIVVANGRSRFVTPGTLATNGFTFLSPDGQVVRRVSAQPFEGWEDGSLEQAGFRFPQGVVAVTGGRLLVADTANHVIRAIDARGAVTTLAGSAQRGRRDGLGLAARFERPTTIRTGPDGRLFVADAANPAVRKVALDGSVSTVAIQTVPGTPLLQAQDFLRDLAVEPDGTLHLLTWVVLNPRNSAGTSALHRVTAAGEAVTVARADSLFALSLPVVAGDPLAQWRLTSSAIYRRAPGAITDTLVAGHPDLSGFRDGRGTEARFSAPSSAAADGVGNLYVLDGPLVTAGTQQQRRYTVRRVKPDGDVRTIAGNVERDGPPEPGALAGTLGQPLGMAWSSGALYLTVESGVLRVVPPAD